MKLFLSSFLLCSIFSSWVLAEAGLTQAAGGPTIKSGWIQTNGQDCKAVCGNLKLESQPSPKSSNRCVSGEVRGDATKDIKFPNGTWGSGVEFFNSNSVGRYCYGRNNTKPQKQDNDRTDLTVGCFCQSPIADPPQELVRCGEPGNGCYDNLRAMQEGKAKLSDGTQIELVSAAGAFKVWKKAGENLIMNASGVWSPENNWQRKLNRDGKSFSDFYLTETDIKGLAGRACPPAVFLNHDNMVAKGRCLYFDAGNQKQGLSILGRPSGLESIDWLSDWSSQSTGRGPDSSYFEGNVKVCADKGMRLPVIYETTVNGAFTKQQGWAPPSGDPGLNVAWAELNGVPSFEGWTWTATAYQVPAPADGYRNYFRRWSSDQAGVETSIMDNGSIRCVLP
ncbi:hypothetical protein EBR03_01535 [bacterium]|nr:hypothetical protein [bacterium]NBW98232.1 hypothetical protein [bacterium]NBX83931.1 hypothetical protein [bacterium]